MTNRSAAQSGVPQLLDGGVGSELKRRGVKLSDRCWSAEANLNQRSLLLNIHRDYIGAGADIVTANTFATARFVLACAGLEARFDEINRAALGIARAAADSAGRDIAVAASLSCLPPNFDPDAYPPQALEYAAYEELCACFSEHGADLILLEMMQDSRHAKLACRAASASGLPFWIGLSCKVNGQSGEPVAFDNPAQPISAAIDALLEFEPEGIAVMHSPLDAIEPTIAAITNSWDGPTGAWGEIPYSGVPGEPAADSVSPQRYREHAARWLSLGVSLLGGCCGTEPRHIAALRQLIDG